MIYILIMQTQSLLKFIRSHCQPCIALPNGNIKVRFWVVNCALPIDAPNRTFRQYHIVKPNLKDVKALLGY